MTTVLTVALEWQFKHWTYCKNILRVWRWILCMCVFTPELYQDCIYFPPFSLTVFIAYLTNQLICGVHVVIPTQRLFMRSSPVMPRSIFKLSLYLEQPQNLLRLICLWLWVTLELAVIVAGRVPFVVAPGISIILEKPTFSAAIYHTVVFTLIIVAWKHCRNSWVIICQLKWMETGVWCENFPSPQMENNSELRWRPVFMGDKVHCWRYSHSKLHREWCQLGQDMRPGQVQVSKVVTSSEVKAMNAKASSKNCPMQGHSSLGVWPSLTFPFHPTLFSFSSLSFPFFPLF